MAASSSGLLLETERELRVPMSEQMHGEIASLNSQIESLDDPRQCYALVKERIHQYRSSGASVPEDLARMERNLLTECLCASQGR